MRAFIAVAAFAAFFGQALAAPIASAYPQDGGIIVTPGDVNDVIITAENTVNGTIHPNATLFRTASVSAVEQLPFEFVNNFGGGQVNAYVTGKDSQNNLVMLKADGTWYYPNPHGATSPQPITEDIKIPLGSQGSTTKIKLPGYISSGRIYFAEGKLQFFTLMGGNGQASLVEPSAVNPSDPSAGINWGFVELTNNESGGLFANISYVDFVGLVLGMSMTAGDGSVQTAQGLAPEAVANICSDLASLGSDSTWPNLCMKTSNGSPIRVISPYQYMQLVPGSFDGYFNDYNDKVWSKYATDTLTINTQTSAGNVACKIDGDLLTCDGDNRGYAKPSAGDVFGCNSGPFAIREGDNAIHYAVVPRLCAAWTRTTMLIDGGDVQPALGADKFYSGEPTSRYSQSVHKFEVDGKGYAFAYDDVTPDGLTNQAGVVADANPQVLRIHVGGF
ncbi:glycoside hydrolase family 64 protein [Aulographum hederae CBS 113979]|uniref:Glycoside hydrolase family 64 protein n=1 Tax=Aulographum hederae CBS 113979 TaxID=1176131 RepID=A0A6G1HFE0_9PEZI|nr:glycoside hydrolase family 64 protein [Aulographum hederae CBS 113979]